jgi:SAM-dependent methyltransferase
MKHSVNTAQADAWNGPEGAHWAEHGEQDATGTAELTEALLAAAGIGARDRVLDIGCGTGATTLLAAARASQGHALGVDLSVLMLERAHASALSAGIGNVLFEQGDVQVHPFAAGHFDVAISQFGIMFFADPVAAFTNIARALRPGGRLAFVCPQDMAGNDWYTVPMSALLQRLGVSRLPESGMFSLADRASTTGVLESAGFTDVRIRPVEVPMAFGADVNAATGFYLGSGPVQAVLQQHEELTPDAAREILTGALRPYEGPDGVRIPGASWLVTART